MSTPTSGLESGEEADNVPLVHLTDAQSARTAHSPAGNSTVSDKKSSTSFEYIESAGTYEDSNESSGSQSEEAGGTEDTEDDDSNSGEMIVPEFVPDELPIDIPQPGSHEAKPNQPGSWPTLEILPGGVIKRGEKEDEDPVSASHGETDPIEDTSGELMYACAKCPERFNLLFSLVKHVRWHEDERKRQLGPNLTKMSRLEKELISIKRARLDVERQYKKQKAEVMSRIAVAVGDLGVLSDIFE